MRNVAWAAAGLVLGAVLVLAVGVLGVQAIGQESGAVLDLANEVVGVTEPQVPWGPALGTALLGALAALALTAGAARLPGATGRDLVAGFTLSTVVLVFWAFQLDADRVADAIDPGVLRGWSGWLVEGGTSAAVHVVVLVCVVRPWLGGVAARRRTAGDRAPERLSPAGAAPDRAPGAERA